MIDPRSEKLQALKGSDLKVLIAMALLGAVNVGNKAIVEYSGLSFPTVAASLARLARKEMVTKTHRTDGWQLTQGGRQMLLPSEPSTKFLHSEAIINIDNPLNTRILKESNTNNTDSSERIFDSEILKGLNSMGIYNPKALDLAYMDHMTQKYIEAWKLALDRGQVGKGGHDIPLAIHLMGQNAPAPIPKKTYKREYARCEICGAVSCEHKPGLSYTDKEII